jgi:hypothetical protein
VAEIVEVGVCRVWVQKSRRAGLHIGVVSPNVVSRGRAPVLARAVILLSRIPIRGFLGVDEYGGRVGVLGGFRYGGKTSWVVAVGKCWCVVFD